MSTDFIRYDLLVQDALRNVVRRVLSDAARDGLPGEHHFCITFRTHAPGVRLSSRVRERHPEEMTIILQHQFWDLLVTEQAFEVGLSFGGVSERLLVPLDAVTGFWDPSVQFGLKFEVQDATPEDGANDSAPPTLAPVKTPAKTGQRAAPRAPALEAAPHEGETAKTKPSKVVGSAKAADAAEGAEPEAELEPDEAAKVVSIDAFRKKT